MAQQVKDQGLSLLWLRSLLWHGIDPWPGNFHIARARWKEGRKEEGKKRGGGGRKEERRKRERKKDRWREERKEGGRGREERKEERMNE